MLYITGTVAKLATAIKLGNRKHHFITNVVSTLQKDHLTNTIHVVQLQLSALTRPLCSSNYFTAPLVRPRLSVVLG